MRVFVSYASEQRVLADRIVLGLRGAGHTVFFDRDALPPGEEFNTAIREEIRKSDLLVFLISPESVAGGGYSRSELAFARQRWPSPRGRVVPVMALATPIDSIDAYLRDVGILEPVGDIVAEVLARVDAIASRRRRRVLLAASVMGVAIVAAAATTWRAGLLGSDQLVRGLVSDRVTGASLEGATVEARRGTRAIASTHSGADGRFSLAFRAREGPFELVVEHDAYEPSSQTLELGGSGRGGDPDQPVKLFARNLRDCRIQDRAGVVVGHFLPPMGVAAEGGELADRIARALAYDLVPRVQPLQLAGKALPSFVSCEPAAPHSFDLGKSYAVALGADAFVSGEVKQANPGYDVHTLVSDAFGLYGSPVPATNSNVKLDDPAAAQLDTETLVAILTAIARGYLERGRYGECIEVTVMAEQMLGRPTQPLQSTRTACQSKSGVLELRPAS